MTVPEFKIITPVIEAKQNSIFLFNFSEISKNVGANIISLM